MDVFVFVNEGRSSQNLVRADNRCGKGFPTKDIIEAKCPMKKIHSSDEKIQLCCSNRGYCGIGPEFCDCVGCVNYQ